MGKTIGIYARVSTLEQNCEVQLADLRRYAGALANISGGTA
jgi:hypothetical protein